MRRIAIYCIICIGRVASVQAQQTQVGAALQSEWANFDMDCVHPQGSLFGAIGGCGQLLFTDHPLHVAVGSLAPQNGFGAGIALSTHYTPNENWRLFWDFDAVATPNLSWRAGGYMTAVLIRHPKLVVLSGNVTLKKRAGPVIEEMPVFHLFAQSISLNKLTYFGMGQESAEAGQSYFGMRETIAGANTVWPVFAPFGLSLFGEANGRFTEIRGDHGASSPSIEQLYSEATAPGLTRQPAYAQFGEGVRLNPSFANGYVRLSYSVGFQEWVSGDSGYSFQRFTADLSHQFPLYRGMRSLSPQEFNGPDDCSADVAARKCPSISRNLEGSFGLRFLYTASFIPTGNTVPFYFDPTLGGSDINGNTVLGSYADYRFRGPDLMLVRGSFEHSIYKYPVGVKFMVDEGRVALTPSDLGSGHLAHSYAAGLTLHAGGLPLVDLLFAWGGTREPTPSRTSIIPCWADRPDRRSSEPQPAANLGPLFCPTPLPHRRTRDAWREVRRRTAFSIRVARSSPSDGQ